VTATGERLVLTTSDAALTVDAAAGGRFASLVVGGDELLLTDDDAGPIWWGCYPMAPFAGRIRFGLLAFEGKEHQLERNLAPHAIHGTVLDRRWDVIAHGPNRVRLETDLGPAWPFAGCVRHEVVLGPDSLAATLTLEADEPMPAWMGWHPWFRRSIDGHALELEFEAASMFERGPDGLPTGALRAPTPRAWDDAFIGLRAAPRLRWPGLLELEIASTAGVWVVFDERDDAMCVEPQTAPPDAVNVARAQGVDPPVVDPGRPLTATMSWRWSRSG
jgi:galactose mutarotase-like enzyme